jgi:hypothetical protein
MIIPIVICLLLVAALAASLWTLLSSKREITMQEKRFRKALAAVQTNLRESEAALREEIHQAGASAAVPAPQSGMNLQKRNYALRLIRRGAPDEHISAVLHLPRREVDLLRKVHELRTKDTIGAA